MPESSVAMHAARVSSGWLRQCRQWVSHGTRRPFWHRELTIRATDCPHGATWSSGSVIAPENQLNFDSATNARHHTTVPTIGSKPHTDTEPARPRRVLAASSDEAASRRRPAAGGRSRPRRPRLRRCPPALPSPWWLSCLLAGWLLGPAAVLARGRARQSGEEREKARTHPTAGRAATRIPPPGGAGWMPPPRGRARGR